MALVIYINKVYYDNHCAVAIATVLLPVKVYAELRFMS